MDDDAIDAALGVLDDDVQPRTELTRMVDNLSPLIDVVREAFLDRDGTFALRINEITPEQRAEIVRLKAMLDSVLVPLTIRSKQLDEAVKIATQRTGSVEWPVAGAKPIKVTQPQVDYQIQEGQLRQALFELIPTGVLTAEDINAALQPTTYYKANNRKLNELAKNRGEEVAAAIAAHRHKPEVPPGRMKVEWPKLND